MFHGAVSAIDMRFSDRPNALCAEKDAAALPAAMCKEGMCAEQASEMLREQSGGGPGADWFPGRPGQMPYGTMHRRADRILRRTVTDSIGHGLVEHPLVAVDKIRIARYGRRPDMTRLIKYRGPFHHRHCAPGVIMFTTHYLMTESEDPKPRFVGRNPSYPPRNAGRPREKPSVNSSTYPSLLPLWSSMSGKTASFEKLLTHRHSK